MAAGFSMVILSVLLLGVPTLELITQSEELLKEGKTLLRQKRYHEALAIFDRFKQSTPEDPQPYFYSGIALAEAGHRREAASELEIAMRLDPEEVRYPLLFAEVLSRIGQLKPALRALIIFEKEESLERLSLEELLRLADTFFRLDKAVEALQILDRCARQQPAAVGIHRRRAEFSLRKGDLETGLAASRKAVETAPQEPYGYYGVGLVLYKKNKLDESKEALLEAVRLSPSNIKYLHQLALVCLALDQPQEAVQYLERTAESQSPGIPYVLAQAHRRLGNREQAREHFEKFREITSAQERAKEQKQKVADLLMRARQQLQKGDFQTARQLFEAVLEKDADDWLAHGYLAKIHLSSPSWRLAYPHLVRMEEISPNTVDGKFLMAAYWYRRQELGVARDYAEDAKRLRPGDGELRNLLGNIYWGLGLREEAAKEYAAAVRLEPDRPDFRLNYESASKNPREF